MARAGGGSEGSSVDRTFLIQSFVIPGLTYPIWPLVAPDDAIDPPILWLALGACFLAVPLAQRHLRLDRSVLAHVMSCIAALVTVHLFILAFLNDMAPFYAVGSVIAVLATGVFIRSTLGILVYSVFVAVLGGTLFAIQPDDAKLAYWGGLVPLLGLAYHRLAAQLSKSRTLERAVRDRSQELSSANERLAQEIEERALLEEELRVLYKMEAVGRLAGGVAHDFNNLLSTITIYTDQLEEQVGDNPRAHDSLGQLRCVTDQAASLTNELLTLANQSHVEFDRVDLNKVVSDACPTLDHLLGDQISLRRELSAAPLPVVANAGQLQRILLNLVINARDAMSGPGVVTIATALAPESRACLTVSDTGPGMTPETRERAFDPFFTTKTTGRGTGLGLSIVHGIVTQAGGEIRLYSELGAGSRMEIAWPLAIAAPDEIDAPIGVSSHTASGNRILLVEDDLPLRKALRQILAKCGYYVEDAADGESALAILEKERSFDLVLTDVVMPQMGGLALAEKIQERWPDLEVLLMSGRLDCEDLARLGKRPVLTKPFGINELIARLRSIIGGRSGLAAPSPRAPAPTAR